MKTNNLSLVTLLLSITCLWTDVNALQSQVKSSNNSRRNFLTSNVKATTFLTIASTTKPLITNALDMDAFMNSQLDNTPSKKEYPTTEKMSDDEALCKFGQPGRQKGDACVRAGLPIEPKKPGGVNAYGEVDRGTFVRCKTSYPLIDGKYTKVVTCSE